MVFVYFDLVWNPEIFLTTAVYLHYHSAILNTIMPAEKYTGMKIILFFQVCMTAMAANFNRVILWFDPYWNNGGTIEPCILYYAGGDLAVNKQIVLPGFLQREKRTSHDAPTKRE